MISIIDNELGNISSISNMLKKIGIESKRIKHPSEITNCSKIILPGVGSFDYGIEKINNSGWKEVIHKKVQDGAFLLGICLGMQLLFDESEEGNLPGLGLISGKVVKFNFNEESFKVPHMGWNEVFVNSNSLLINENDKQRFYFVHSYHAICKNKFNEIGNTNYGYNFTSIVQNDRVFGVQFHPEKSHKFGMNLLTNFANL
jgi:glutamine amidotransferase